MSASNVFSFDFKSGKMVPITAAGLIPVGSLVTYSDCANPQREFVVTGAEIDRYATGQRCTCEDGHTSGVSMSAINGPGGWELDRRGRVLDADGVAEFLRVAAAHKIIIEEGRKQAANESAILRAATRVKLLSEWPQLERAEGSKKSGHALGAANLRKVLAKTWPGIKFSVTSKSYSGGNSIDVRWMNGPTSSAVDKVADRFQECDFDGMTDSESYRNGVFPDLFGGAKYVSCSRETSQEARAGLAEQLGLVLTFDQWGNATGFRDWDEERYFSRELHARDFLAAPLKAPEPPRDMLDVLRDASRNGDALAVNVGPAPAMPEHCPILCW